MLNLSLFLVFGNSNIVSFFGFSFRLEKIDNTFRVFKTFEKISDERVQKFMLVSTEAHLERYLNFSSYSNFSYSFICINGKTLW
jgi:hypothetical protein